MVWQAMAAGGLAGALGSSSRNKMARRMWKKQRRFMSKARGEFGIASSIARAKTGEGIEAQREGYGKALASVSKTSRTARREAKERSTKREGELLSRYGIGGRYGSTAMDQARAGIGSRLTRDMESIDASLAGLLGELEIGKGAAEAAGQRQIGNIFLGEGAFGSSLSQQLAGMVPQKEDPLMGALGGALGAYSGAGGY